MRYLRTAAAITGALGIAASVASCTLPAPSATGESVVIVETNGSHGSGAHLGGGLVLTAAHVVNGGKDFTYTIRDRHNVRSNVAILWANSEKDIALLKIEDASAADKIPAAALFCGDVNEGDAITVIGSPLNVEFVSGFGRIAGVARKIGPVDSVYVVDVATVMGQSGGPLFHNGKIVGVVSMVMVAPMPSSGPRNADGRKNFTPSITGYGYAVPSSVVCGLMGRTA